MFKAIFTRAARSASLTNMGFDIKNLCRVFPQSNNRSSEYFAKLLENCFLAIENGASDSDLSHCMGKSVSHAKTYGASEDDIKELCAFALALMRAIAVKNQTLINRLDDDVNSFFIRRTGAPISEEHVIKVFRRWGFTGKEQPITKIPPIQPSTQTDITTESDSSTEYFEVMDSIRERLVTGQIVADLSALQRNHDGEGVETLLDAIQTTKSALELMEQYGSLDDEKKMALHRARLILGEKHKYRTGRCS